MPRMEARLWRDDANVTFPNMRCVYTAVAYPGRHHYVHGATAGNHSVPCASGVTAVRHYGIAWFGGFDGPLVALFPDAVHSPRDDGVYDCERGKVHLRRWNRRGGGRGGCVPRAAPP